MLFLHSDFCTRDTDIKWINVINLVFDLQLLLKKHINYKINEKFIYLAQRNVYL
jgi:hypothetical protein